MLTLRLRGISRTGDKAETRAETFDSYSQHPFVLLPMRVEIPQNKPSLRFSTVLKMDTPPFLTVVVQGLNRVSFADIEEVQLYRFKFDASGCIWSTEVQRSRKVNVLTGGRREHTISTPHNSCST